MARNSSIFDPLYFMERSTLDPSLFFPLSPPTFDHESFHDLLLASHLLPTPPPSGDRPAVNRNMGTAASSSAAAAVTSKGSGGRRERAHRKDRHSKIVTAKGLRDRRMRLSLEVSRKFFDLQDALGFDKASKTVNWLFTKSESAIKDLARRKRRGCDGGTAKSESSSSECEVVSQGVGDSERSLISAAAEGSATGGVSVQTRPKLVAKTPPLRKDATHPTLAKELRILARARARERTREKKASSSSHFETTMDESVTQDLKSSVELMAEVEQPIPPYSPNRCNRIDSHERADEILSMMTMNMVPGLVSSSDCDQNLVHDVGNFSFLQEQWNMLLT